MPKKVNVNIDELVRLYVDEKLSLDKIGKLMECSQFTVNRRIVLAGVTLRKGGRQINVASEELVRLYVDEKLGLDKISELVGCSYSTVKRRLVLAGVTPRKTGRQVRHGAARRDGRTREYQSYRDAKKRCSRPNRKGYANYGGRGIRFLFLPASSSSMRS